jgi:hypothetical protein
MEESQTRGRRLHDRMVDTFWSEYERSHIGAFLEDKRCGDGYGSAQLLRVGKQILRQRRKK